MKDHAAAGATMRSAGGCLFLMAATAICALSLSGVVHASSVELDAETLPDGGNYIDARFRTSAPAEVVWDVLTDYEGLPSFVSSLYSSRLDLSAAPAIVLHQEGTAQFLLVRRRMSVRLLIEETPKTEIFFRDLSGQDFRSYGGRWTIETGSSLPGGGETTELIVGYELEARPKAGAPGFVKKKVLKRTVRNLLEQVRAEIERRQAGRSVADPEDEEVLEP